MHIYYLHLQYISGLSFPYLSKLNIICIMYAENQFGTDRVYNTTKGISNVFSRIQMH